MITVSHHMCHILTLPDLGGGGGGRAEQPKSSPSKTFDRDKISKRNFG